MKRRTKIDVLRKAAPDLSSVKRTDEHIILRAVPDLLESPVPVPAEFISAIKKYIKSPSNYLCFSDVQDFVTYTLRKSLDELNAW